MAFELLNHARGQRTTGAEQLQSRTKQRIWRGTRRYRDVSLIMLDGLKPFRFLRFLSSLGSLKTTLRRYCSCFDSAVRWIPRAQSGEDPLAEAA